jgi:hypothetical protein
MADESHLRLSPDVIAKLAEGERQHRRQQFRALIILVVSLAVGVGLIVYALDQVAKTTQPAKVVIDPAKLPPIRPGPPR